MKKRTYHFIGAASGWGAQIRTCEDGPLAFKAPEGTVLYPKVRFREKNVPLSEALPLIVDFNCRLADHVHSVMQKGQFPIVTGGDHSIAVGTWNGVAQSLSLEHSLGLIWIDAHMDAHTPQTTPS